MPAALMQLESAGNFEISCNFFNDGFAKRGVRGETGKNEDGGRQLLGKRQQGEPADRCF